MTRINPIHTEIWTPHPASVDAHIEMLGDVLHACVQAGASVSFVVPFSLSEAKTFWRDQVLPAVYDGSRRVLLARWAEQIVGTVQIDRATPPNQPHRAEVKKLLVHPRARRRGIARSLMLAVEDQARAERRTLLTLDTVRGSSAERLYVSLGYVRVGVIPGYALNFDARELEDAVLMYKRLPAASGAHRISQEK